MQCASGIIVLSRDLQLRRNLKGMQFVLSFMYDVNVYSARIRRVNGKKEKGNGSILSEAPSRHLSVVCCCVVVY
jgi:hypothetical protein